MALLFATNTPQALLSDFKKKIDSKEIVTWTYNQNGDFTHIPDQWRGKGWLRPHIDVNGLRFNFHGGTGIVTTWAIYGVYQGRFIESMITHCHDLFSSASATPKPTNSDVMGVKVA